MRKKKLGRQEVARRCGVGQSLALFMRKSRAGRVWKPRLFKNFVRFARENGADFRAVWVAGLAGKKRERFERFAEDCSRIAGAKVSARGYIYASFVKEGFDGKKNRQRAD
jgi:hypothetical protein